MPSEKKHQKLHGLDHLRALAIIMVFFCHYQQNIFGHPAWLSYAAFGWTGVDLFFVLSGFLISSQLFTTIKNGCNISYKEFFLKRAFRILPAFFAVTAIYYLLPVFREEPTLPPLSRLLTFTHNLGLDVSVYNAFSHAWSLCVEEHFYIALPITLILLSRFNLLRSGPWLICFLFAGGIALRYYCWRYQYLPQVSRGNDADWYRFLYYPTYTRLDGLLCGVTIAIIYVFSPAIWQQLSKYGNTFILLGLSVLGVGFLACDHPTYNIGTVGFLIIDIGYACLVIAAVSPSSILYKFRSRVTAIIATLSYGIYLSHKGVIHMTQHAAAAIGLNVNSIAVLLICIAACAFFALALYHIVELPFIKIKARMLRTKRAQTVAPDPSEQIYQAIESTTNS
jgi:peptidoglycan/LPS O-acetylase OafA/YrhL